MENRVIQQNQRLVFEKINKIGKILASFTKESEKPREQDSNREKTQFTKIRNERGNFITHMRNQREML